MNLNELAMNVERLRRRAAEGRNSIRVDDSERSEAEAASLSLEHHLAVVALEHANAASIRQAEHALRCLARGERVRCVDCQNPIPLSRLTAVPSATRCVKCQELFEEWGEQRSAEDR